jgi:dTDP-4-amino-4,6-dideoxygalactose transaminase
MTEDVLVSYEVLEEGGSHHILKKLLERGVRLWITPYTHYRLKASNLGKDVQDLVNEIPVIPLPMLAGGETIDSPTDIEIEVAKHFKVQKVLCKKPTGDPIAETPESYLNKIVGSEGISISIPLVDLKRQLWEISTEVFQDFAEIFATSAYVQGKYVKEFEKAFARLIDVPYVVAVNNGTSALILALLALGVKEGDEVITTPFTFIATAEAISFVGAKPVFVDIRLDDYTIDPEKIEVAITDKTRGIIPVHLYGQPANMDPILEIAKKYGLFVLEDACQAHGARYRSKAGWKSAGGIGDVAAFSFYPGKNLGAFGEGGAVTTFSKELAEKMRLLRDHGAVTKYDHRYIGLNLRMENFQGAVLKSKVKRLERWNEQRREIARFYSRNLKGLPLELPLEKEYAYHVYHLYVVRTEERDRLLSFLKERRIFCGIHYPKPLHLQEAYSFLGYRAGDFPNAEKAAREVLSLPIFQGMRMDEAARVVEAVHQFFGGDQ